MGLHQLIYMSKLATDDSVLNSIHSHAVRNNTARTMTGMLLFAQGRFLQVLEGERKDVQHTFERIKEDRRHDHVTLIADKPIVERSFSHWNMGFKALSENEAKANAELMAFFSKPLDESELDSDTAIHLLLAYA